jgi:hypothetical protein
MLRALERGLTEKSVLHSLMRLAGILHTTHPHHLPTGSAHIKRMTEN